MRDATLRIEADLDTNARCWQSSVWLTSDGSRSTDAAAAAAAAAKQYSSVDDAESILSDSAHGSQRSTHILQSAQSALLYTFRWRSKAIEEKNVEIKIEKNFKT